MNHDTSDETLTDAPLPFPTQEERDALILEFQRLAARLTRAGLLSRASSTRLMRSMNQERRLAEDKRHALPELLLAILLSLEDGTLMEGRDFVHGQEGLVALHLESVAPVLFRAQRTSWAPREMRRLFHFGWLHFREVVRARSERMRFGREEDRRRTVVVHVPSAYEFVGSRPKAVPSR
ncbi:MAG: hypothetical protein H5U40_16535 [Polyangiaceae bacterium]|nr:hypothetical protein [Polyangiaceae bacterium]